jgi:hypothetical protein
MLIKYFQLAKQEIAVWDCLVMVHMEVIIISSQINSLSQLITLLKHKITTEQEIKLSNLAKLMMKSNVEIRL